MTFTPAAWAIDGATAPGSLARLAVRAGVKESGVIEVGDLKVAQLAAPGNGVRILPGGGALKNLYEVDSSQTYVVENLAEQLVNSTTAVNWPATNPGVARSHLVCVSIGDPQYSSAGHGWFTEVMRSDLVANPETALDFQYVRPFIIPNVPSNTVRIEDLASPPAFPCYALARLDLPSNWTTIASAQIIDLRDVVNPRSKVYEQHAPTSVNDVLTVAAPNTYEYWPDQSNFGVYIPEWASYCYADGFIEGFRQNIAANVIAGMKIWSTGANIGTGSSKYNDNTTGRKSINLGGKFSIPVAFRGTTQNFQIQATPQDVPSQGKLTTDAWTSSRILLRFVEQAD